MGGKTLYFINAEALIENLSSSDLQKLSDEELSSYSVELRYVLEAAENAHHLTPEEEAVLKSVKKWSKAVEKELEHRGFIVCRSEYMTSDEFLNSLEEAPLMRLLDWHSSLARVGQKDETDMTILALIENEVAYRSLEMSDGELS